MAVSNLRQAGRLPAGARLKGETRRPASCFPASHHRSRARSYTCTVKEQTLIVSTNLFAHLRYLIRPISIVSITYFGCMANCCGRRPVILGSSDSSFSTSSSFSANGNLYSHLIAIESSGSSRPCGSRKHPKRAVVTPSKDLDFLSARIQTQPSSLGSHTSHDGGTDLQSQEWAIAGRSGTIYESIR